jgi:hypothetical protein
LNIALPQTSPKTPAARRPHEKRGVHSAWLVVAVVALGAAIQVRSGLFDPKGMLWLTIAYLAGLVGVLGPGMGRWHPRRVVLGLLIAGLLFQFFQYFDQSPTIDFFSFQQRSWFDSGIALAEASVAASLLPAPIHRPALAAMLAVYVALGLLVILGLHTPGIDSYLYTRDASFALLHGHNPYAIVIRDIYPPRISNFFYGPDASVNGYMIYGYPYPPVPLLAALPGALLGDYRIAYLVVIVLTAWLIADLQPNSPIAAAAAAMFLFTPRSYFILEQGWTDPVVVALLALTVWTALRHPRWLAVPLGLLLASKQYMIVAAPAVWLLLPAVAPGKRVRMLIETALVGALSSVPLAIIGGKRFWLSVVVWLTKQPFRPDSLSYSAWLVNIFPQWSAHHGVIRAVPIVVWVLAAGAAALCLWRVPRTPAGFAAALGLTMAAFIGFNKQAFCNHYYFVIAAFCTAIAATPIAQTRSQKPAPPRRNSPALPL